jgi:hypothetical protein
MLSFLIIIVSIVGVLNDPALKLDFTVFSPHTISKPKFSHLIIEENGHDEGH